MSENSRKLYHARKEAGLCTRCGKANLTNYVQCDECRIKTNLARAGNNNKLYYIRREAGTCGHCGQAVTNGSCYCDLCKEVHNKAASTLRRNNPIKHLLYAAKQRATKAGLPFDLVEEDIIIPKTCPVLGIPLVFNNSTTSDNSPSLDRIFPELGYISGNVRLISFKANRIKTNATVNEMEKVLKYMQRTMV
jgi:hypothetical protein